MINHLRGEGKNPSRASGQVERKGSQENHTHYTFITKTTQNIITVSCYDNERLLFTIRSQHLDGHCYPMYLLHRAEGLNDVSAQYSMASYVPFSELVAYSERRARCK